MKYLAFIFFVYTLVSCQKDNSIPPSLESKLTTIWVFEDAFSSAGSGQSSIYSEYKNDQIRFNEGGNLSYAEDLGLGTTRNGTWGLDSYETIYQDIDGFDSVEVTNILNISIGEGNNKEEYSWEFDLLENETLLVGNEIKQNRKYVYWLRKKY
ncbi:MAG: hypothetical protein GY810_06695 [Aureispira sp.]|nr:hypothetical protein [Aureispira sp.]